MKSRKTSRKKSTQSKKQSAPWFIAVRGSFLPYAWQGWATYVPYTLVLFGSVWWAEQSATSLIDIVFRAFPVWVAAAVTMHYIATISS